MNKIYTFCILLLLSVSSLWAQVSNDNCYTAEVFPDLIPGIQTCIDGNNINALAEQPFTNQANCLNGGDMPSAAADVWYMVQAVGNIMEVDLNSSIDNVVLAFYEGECEGLIGRDCEISNNGVISTTFAPVAPGAIYYIQVSSTNTTDFGSFELCINNYDITTNYCINSQTFFVDPLPQNGNYTPGQTVQMCLSVGGYVQNSADWLHGIVPVFGPGWDISTLIAEPPASCSDSGVWDWYELCTPDNTSAINAGPQGPGFFYETTSGSTSGTMDDEPGNNYGDNSNGDACDWLFCLTITAKNDCPEGFSSEDLTIEFLNFSDAETGSWNSSSPCPQDPNYKFKVELACCTPPTLSAVNPSCANPTGGNIVATGVGNPPFTFVWSNGFTETGAASTLSDLGEGFYSVTATDATGCQAANSVTLEEQNLGLTLNIPVSIEGCVGCEASIQNPQSVSLIASSTGATFGMYSITGCPSNISTCLLGNESYHLSYNGQTINNVVVNGALQLNGATAFTFVTGTPANAGTMPTQQQVVCSGETVGATTTGAVVDNGNVLAYYLHTNAGDALGQVLASNGGGTFAYTDNATLQYNTTYYISAVAGPDSGDGTPILNSGCTDVANGTPVVFLSPVVITVNEDCDWSIGDYTVVILPNGGYGSFNPDNEYAVTGTITETLANGQTASVVFTSSQTPNNYEFTAVDDLGCVGNAAADFPICLKTPIELLDFAGKITDNGNLLTWVTASETNNHYFTLERSTDGTHFVALTRVNGAGTSFAEQNYQYLDRYAPNGIAYYRLSQTDYNGETTTAKEVVVLQRTQSHATLQIEQVYGLGNTNEVYLNINNPQTSPVRLQVYSITGQLLHTQTYQTQAGSNVLWCNSQVWAKGVYTFVVQSDTETAVAKWCKQ